MTHPLTEILIKQEYAYTGNFLELYRDQVRLPDGRPASREYIHHPGAIAAVPLLDDGKILLVRQFRYPTREVLLEIPAGKLDPGEAPEACVRRELAEEIGYRPEHLTPLISFWTTPGFTDEVIHLYLATGLKPVTGASDPDEFLEIVKLDRAEFRAELEKGAIIDGKTVLAFYLMEARKLWK
jgi:ADP-ribose pyrophosphatase